MIDAIKKTLLAGVGAAVITKDKVEAALSELVRQGKISTDDARIMAEKIADQGRQEFDELSHRLGEKFRELTNRPDSQAQARIDSLEARIRELEARLASTRPPSGQS
jgi:polyhydroxyalkanoate synthesis regulator phasin